jgi:predicted secreted protein
MATGLSGTALVVLIDGVALGGEVGATIPRTNSSLDVSAKADYPNKAYIAGWNDSTLSLDGLYVADDAAWAALLSAYENQTAVTLSEQESGAVIYTASAIITNLTKGAPQDGAISATAEFQITGGWAAA